MNLKFRNTRSSHPEVFLQKAVLKLSHGFTGEHPRRNVNSIKMQHLCGIELILNRWNCLVNASVFCS